jgi:serine/threonine protein kinase
MDFYHNKRDLNGKHLGIIHRDLTPKNVLVSIYGEVKISDFGIAKFEDKKDLTSFGEVKGKPSYMSPEQIKLLPNLDNRVDLFSLGVMFYELLANKHPFREGNIFQTQQNIMNGKYPPLSEVRNDLSPEIENIVYKLLEVDRDKRYLSAGLVKKDLLNLKEQISTQLVFSRYATELLQPGYVNYIQSILPDVHSRSDYRMIKKDKKVEKSFSNKKKFFLYGIIAIIAFNIGLFAFTLSRNSKIDQKLKEIAIIEKKGDKKDNAGVQNIEPIQKDENSKDKGTALSQKDKDSKDKGTALSQKDEDSKDKGTALSQKDKKEENTGVQDIDPIQKEVKEVVKKKVVKRISKATLDIYVIPFGDIYLDGKKISSVTRLGYKIKAGKHKLEIKDSSGKTREVKMINLKAGEKKEFRFNLN